MFKKYKADLISSDSTRHIVGKSVKDCVPRVFVVFGASVSI